MSFNSYSFDTAPIYGVFLEGDKNTEIKSNS